jgi:hypothetical protein
MFNKGAFVGKKTFCHFKYGFHLNWLKAGQPVSRLIFLMLIPRLELMTLAGYTAIKKAKNGQFPRTRQRESIHTGIVNFVFHISKCKFEAWRNLLHYGKTLFVILNAEKCSTYTICNIRITYCVLLSYKLNVYTWLRWCQPSKGQRQALFFLYVKAFLFSHSMN